jgi:putative copper export protein
VNVSRLLIDFLHLFFAAAWIGAVVQLTRLTAPPEQVEKAWPAIESALRFASNYLLVAATMMVITGLFKLNMILDADPGVFRSMYGQVLAAKIVLALAMFGMALWNHLAVFRRMSAAATASDWQSVLIAARRSSRFFKIILTCSLVLLLLVAGLSQL